MNIGRLHVAACRHRKGLIQEAKLLVVAPTNGGHSIGSVSPQEGIHRSGGKTNKLLPQLIDSVMCSEQILHVSVDPRARAS